MNIYFDDDLSKILNDNSISDDLKVRLYTMFRKKYNNAVNVRESDDDGADLEDDEDFIMKRKTRQRELVGAIRDIAENLPAGKTEKCLQDYKYLDKKKIGI